MQDKSGRYFSKEALSMNGLTHSCLEILTNMVWTHVHFENNLAINHLFAKHLKESCEYDYDEHFSFKYFLKYALRDRYRQTMQIVCWRYGHE